MSSRQFEDYYESIKGYISTLDTRELLRRTFEAGKVAKVDSIYSDLKKVEDEWGF